MKRLTSWVLAMSVGCAAACAQGLTPGSAPKNGHYLVTQSESKLPNSTVVNNSAALSATSGGTGSATAPSSGQLPVGNAGGTAYVPKTVGGDATMSSTGSLTVTKTAGVGFASSATTDTTNAANITAGTLPVIRGGTGAASLTGNGAVIINNAGTAATTVPPGNNGNLMTSNGTAWTSAAPPASANVGGNGFNGAGTEASIGDNSNTRDYNFTTLTIGGATGGIASGTCIHATGTITWTSGGYMQMYNGGSGSTGGSGGNATDIRGQDGGGLYGGEGGVLANEGGGGGAGYGRDGGGGFLYGGAAGNVAGGQGGLARFEGSSGGGGSSNGTTGTGGTGGGGMGEMWVCAAGAITFFTSGNQILTDGNNGSGATTGGGGGGGGAAATCGVFSNTSINFPIGAAVRGLGGNGGNGAGTNGNGGGGGSGSFFYFCSPSNTTGGTITVTGGTKGLKGGAGGVDGTNGDTGGSAFVVGSPSRIFVQRFQDDYPRINRLIVQQLDHVLNTDVQYVCQVFARSPYDFICLLTGESPTDLVGLPQSQRLDMREPT